MKQIKHYEELLNNVDNIVSSLLYPEAFQQMVRDKNSLLVRLQNERGIKVPVVGNFNAGKSSLLNVLLGKGEILPTNIAAETAIPYELYPMVGSEHVELYRNGDLIVNVDVSDIKSLNIAPGDVARMYIDNTFIRDLVAKGVILVDMPGLDSGIKEHNDAIMHYINNGTAFVFLVDIETGALTRTAIAFIKELLSYNLCPAIFVSKTDQKQDSERRSILNYVKNQVHVEIDTKVCVGEVSAAEGRIEEFVNYISELDPEILIANKYRCGILQFINRQIASLKSQVALINADFDEEEAKRRIKELEDEKKGIEKKFSGDIEKADTPEKSTMDILDQIREALSDNAESIATSIVKKETSEEINSQILSILRPVIVKAFQKEGGEYAAALNGVVDDISKAFQKVLNIDEALIDSVVDEYKEEIQNFISTAADLLRNNNNPYVQIIAQLLDFFGEVIPDFIRWVFGKSEEDKIADATSRINTSMYSTLQRKLYPVLLEQVKGQQERIKAKVIEQVNIQVIQIEEIVRTIIKERDKAKEAMEQKKEQLLQAITSLETLI